MKSAYFILLAACSSPQKPDPNPTNTESVYKDSRTQIEKRRDTACETIQPKLTTCAVADAKATMSPSELAKLKPDELVSAHKQKFLKECKASAMSSRQVRVLEVCYKAETECEPLAECLKNLEPQKSKT